MPDAQLRVAWKKVFLALVFLVGGGTFVFIPAASLPGSSLADITFGVVSLMLGSVTIWEATASFRTKRK